jgi:hypothetical protein
MTLSDLIQLVAVLAAVGASIVALVIASRDRKTQLQIAKQARNLDRLSVELQYAIRLSANRNMGGSSDPAESKRLGSEALALAGVVGQRWVPRLYSRSMNYRSTEELRERLEDDDQQRTPRWVKDKIEAGLAVQAIIAEMYGTSGEELPQILADPDNQDAVDDGMDVAG